DLPAHDLRPGDARPNLLGHGAEADAVRAEEFLKAPRWHVVLALDRRNRGLNLFVADRDVQTPRLLELQALVDQASQYAREELPPVLFGRRQVGHGEGQLQTSVQVVGRYRFVVDDRGDRFDRLCRRRLDGR